MIKFCKLASFLLLLACNYQANKEVFSGGAIIDPMSADGTVGLSYRVNQTAIDFHSFSALLSDLKTVDESLLPSSWPKLNLLELTKAFCYIHKEDQCSLPVISFNLIEKNSIDRHVTMNLIDGSQFIFDLNKQVDKILWNNDLGHNVLMTKKNDQSWLIQVDHESLSWNPFSKQICYGETCVHFAL
jgi:hypothetical protein